MQVLAGTGCVGLGWIEKITVKLLEDSGSEFPDKSNWAIVGSVGLGLGYIELAVIVFETDPIAVGFALMMALDVALA